MLAVIVVVVVIVWLLFLFFLISGPSPDPLYILYDIFWKKSRLFSIFFHFFLKMPFLSQFRGFSPKFFSKKSSVRIFLEKKLAFLQKISYIMYMDNNDIFIEAQKRLGMTGRALASALGITERSVSAYVTRERKPTSRIMDRLSALLAEREAVDVVRSDREAHLLYLYRGLSPENQDAVDRIATAIVAALHANSAPPQPPQPTA
jgi:transcriptional regulator with XRE-family HTH domain